MAKKFDIHEWQAKQRLAEMMHPCPTCGKMNQMDPQYDGPGGEGKMAKGDAIELAKDASDVAGMIGPESNLPEWIESKITLAADYLNVVKDYLSNYDASRQKLSEQDKSQESMSNADIGALQKVVGEYSLNKILKTIAVIADRIGKTEESDMIEKLANKIQDFEQEDELDEASTLGTGTSFQAGSGEGYMTPNAFGDNQRKKKKGYMGYKEV